MDKFKQNHFGLKMVLGGLFFALLIFVSVKAGPAIVPIACNPGKFAKWLESYGPFSMAAYIALQALVMILTPIPSEALLFTGGYLYGVIPGAACSLAAISCGTMFAFAVAHHFGMPLVKTLIPSKLWQKFGNIQQNPLLEWGVFLFFLIPGLPKDALTYVVGLTTARISRSLLIVLIARTPGIIISSYIGANLRDQNYLPLFVGLSIVSVLILIGLMLKDKILSAMEA
jgi:Uncharacterized conserved protein